MSVFFFFFTMYSREKGALLPYGAALTRRAFERYSTPDTRMRMRKGAPMDSKDKPPPLANELDLGPIDSDAKQAEYVAKFKAQNEALAPKPVGLSAEMEAQMMILDQIDLPKPTAMLARQEDLEERRRSTREIASRMRAHRSNMLRALNKKFMVYQQFTPQGAAIAINRDLDSVETYLEYEAALGGSRIVKCQGGTFMILTGFESADHLIRLASGDNN
jgi:hypothetical protein